MQKEYRANNTNTDRERDRETFVEDRMFRRKGKRTENVLF